LAERGNKTMPNNFEMKLNKLPASLYWPEFLAQDKAEILSLLSSYREDSDYIKYLFKKYVVVVLIETSSYCNRTCGYCPLGFFDRSVQNRIDDGTWDTVLSQLKSINYDSVVGLQLYNEPLADETIVDKIADVKERLPATFIKMHSNGDYLDGRMVEKLANAGLKAILVTLHPGKDQPYEDQDRLRHFAKFFQRIGMTADYKVVPNVSVRAEVFHKDLRIFVMADNWGEFGIDRAGTLSALSKRGRTAPCVRPFRELTVTHEGYVYPCCQFFSGDSANDKFRIGQVSSSNTIFDIYGSKMMSSFRRNLLGFNPKMSPCDTCAEMDHSTPGSAALRAELLNMIETGRN